ncbi:uncharacterized protein LOC142167059 [Nicotiana tabacum]|uniref:Uncharacterized protein LOC142167059 n=1 Tax=Nicotiana tabacum TaxID=4097 RepID=A0AC58SEB1_TOBAC
MGLLQFVPPNRQNPKSPSYRSGTRCAYHSGAEGHDTEDCWTLKRAVENLIEQKRVVLRDEEVPNVTNNPLPTRNNGTVIGMICDDKEFYPALKAIIAIVDSEARPKAAVKQARNEKKITLTPQITETNTGAAPAKDAILYVPRAPRKEQLMLNTPKRFEQRKVTLNVPKGTYVVRGRKTVVTYKGKEIMGEVNEMNQPKKYHNLEEQKMLKLSKDKRFSPKKPMNSEEAEEFFQKMKTLEYAIIDQLRKTPSQVLLLSLFISSNEHQKGAAHNKALHLTVKCEGYYMKRVMLDGGSGLDICPLSTLQRMKIGTERIRPNNVCVRALDGVKRDTIGEIDLILTIGPVDFDVTFQVLDMDTTYNFLLGRPWIHTAGSVPSTLHQMVKFEHENQEIVVHEEDEQSIYKDPFSPMSRS